MSCKSPTPTPTSSICRGERSFVFAGVYILVVVGFFMNVHNLQHFKTNYNNNKNDAAPAVRVPSSLSSGALATNGLIPSVCGKISTPVPIFWKQFETEIKEAAVKDATWFLEDQNNNTEFTEWIDELFQDHYQSYQVQRSAIHPPGLEVMMKVLEIISKRLNYLRHNISILAAPPLHILVTGGSLTAGTSCGVNHIGLKQPHWSRGYAECAWPARLEHLLNRVLFNGGEVVKVSNLAAGGSNSEIGKAVLEYQLFPDSFQPPDIVIWSHASNDSLEKDKERAFFESIPGYVNAAHNLRICDDHLPLVVMNEEFFGQNNDMSGAVFKASNWFGLMGISQRNVISHKIFANFDNDDYVNRIIGQKGVHPGMGGHIGASWTVFYNFISAFTDACDYARISSSPMPIKSNDVTAKRVGPYKENDYGKISSEWKTHQDKISEVCLSEKALASSSINSTAASISSNQQKQLVSPCTYAFMANRMTSESTAAAVGKKLNEVLTSNSGWKAEGFPIKQPRIGFYAKERDAHFSLKIDVSMATKYMTIMSMKSYGDNFKDTNLEVDVTIQKNGASTSAEAMKSSSKYEVSGYHETKTSIHIPHKFALPDGGAKKGDIIFVNFRLVSGSYFKIAGLAFCRY